MLGTFPTLGRCSQCEFEAPLPPHQKAATWPSIGTLPGLFAGLFLFLAIDALENSVNSLNGVLLRRLPIDLLLLFKEVTDASELEFFKHCFRKIRRLAGVIVSDFLDIVSQGERLQRAKQQDVFIVDVGLPVQRLEEVLGVE